MVTAAVQEKLKHLPESPGIYQMLNADGMIIYIGKSKCLKKRVSSYFVPEPRWEKAKKMAPFIRNIEYVVTDTHLEAMLLECSLIKSIRPYFNVMMKHDEKYVYLELGQDNRKSPLGISSVKTEESFGPLRSKGRLEELIQGMRYLYPLVKRRSGRYGLFYHSLPEAMDAESYQKNRCILREVCTDPSAMAAFIVETECAMKQAARRQKYELALKYRNLTAALRYLEKGLNTYQKLMGSDIIYTVPLSEGHKMFYIRNGLVMGAKKVMTAEWEQKNNFADEVRKQIMEVEAPIQDKESVDYRSIVLTELADADENAVTYLSGDNGIVNK